jgi:hypothetical protein
MTKYLLEFHRARPTRRSLEQSISTGNLELIKLMRERLPKAELRDRLDLIEIASDFHQLEVVEWLSREATVIENEVRAVFALERKLADVLVESCKNGLRPWWYGARDFWSKWRASAKVNFVSAPEGFSAQGGWWRSKGGAESAWPPLESAVDDWWVLPASTDTDNLVQAALPAGVKRIGMDAFMGCSGLMRLEIPPTVVAIGESALSGCSGLTRLQFPSSVTTIEKSAFEGCSGLTWLEIPLNVTMIGEAAFKGCSGLTRLEIPWSVKTIGKSAFWGCSGLTQLKIQWGVTGIGDAAFYACSGLTELEIPPGMRTIGESAFSGCSGLIQVKIPSTMRAIGKGAFCGCASLTQLEIPAGVSNLGVDVFKGVKKLELLTLLSAPLSPAVVASLKGCLFFGPLTATKVVGSALRGQMFDRWSIFTE